MDTIFALASAQGKAGVAVIRLSGPMSHAAASQLCGTRLAPRGMVLRDLRDIDGALLDQALILTFSAPGSFTGENVAELQIHGSTAAIVSVLEALAKIDGLRQADPGEFTRRALENNKMDLAQVEGLADLIEAETDAQRRQAQNLLGGHLGVLAERWRRDLIRASALIAATIDFADEDVPTDVTPEVNALVAGVQLDLEQQTAGISIAERIRTGFEVAIVGAPNVGKSSLLNALAGRAAAITSEHAGTTRDVIEVRMDLAGLPVTLLDTAGLRDTEDLVEGLGIALARRRAEAADLRVFLAEDDEILEVTEKPEDIRVLPKGDLRKNKQRSVSGLTGEGLDQLVQQISEVLARRSGGAGIASRERHRIAMVHALSSLSQVRIAMEQGPELYDIAAEELRQAVQALDSLVGRVDVESLLDEIFSSFCLGK